MQILLVDERLDELALLIPALTLELPGLQIREINNFDGLNQALATHNFDLVIIHDPLPWTTGHDLVRLLRAQSNCPIIMFTNSGDLGVAVAAMKAGLDDYVVQSPDDTVPLVQAVRRALQNVPTRRDRLDRFPNQPEFLCHLPFTDSPYPMWVYDPKTLKFLAVNQAAIHHYGYSEAEFLSMTITQIRLPEDVPLLLEKVADIEPISRSGEWRHRKRDGTLIDVEITSHQITWQDQVAHLVIIKEITAGKAAETFALEQAQLYQQAQQELSQRQQAEAALQLLNQELEQRVQEQTQQLQQEAHIRRQAEVRFQQIFHISPHAIAITSLHDRRIIEINDAFCQLFGYSHEEMMGHNADEFTLFSNPTDQGLVQRRLMEMGSVRNLECVIRTKTGETRTAIASAEFIDIDDLSCFLIIGNDITERKQAEEALRQSEARFQKIAAASPAQIHILVTDLDGSLIRFEYISPAVWELREASPEQLLQNPAPIYDQIHPDDRVAYFVARNRSLETMEPFFHEYRIVLPSGQVKWVRVNSRPERQENDEIFWYGIVLDVSDRKQVEAALQRSERWLQNFSQQIITMVYTFVQDSQGLSWFEYISCTCEVLLETSVEQAMRDSSSILNLIHPDDRSARFEAISYSQQTLEPYQSEYRMIMPSGKLKWMQVYAQIELRSDGSFAWYGVLIDISDRKRIEQQLRTSLKEKEVLLREVYHRVKNNMQLVSSLLHLQASSIDEPTVLRLLNESQQRVKTMALIHERLYRSKNLARLNVATYIQDLVNNLVRSYTTARSSIRVTLDLADVELDLDRAVPCGLIINELVSNALKYAFPEQKGEIRLAFWLEDTKNYCLIVKDNGIGIPAHINPQYTDSLGMQLVYGLTEQLGGEIELDIREGCQFRITFRQTP